MEQVASVAPRGHQLLVKVETPDCWPLPFYLRGFPNVGYWSAPTSEMKGADVVIGTDELGERLCAPDAEPRYVASSFGLRPGVVLWIYVKEELWKKIVK
jgi:hypothetical protein